MKKMIVSAVILSVVLFSACGTKKVKVGIITETSAGGDALGRTAEDKLVTAINKSGYFEVSAGFGKFQRSEFAKEHAKMESGGSYYEVNARLAKRFGIRYVCLLYIESDVDIFEITAFIYDSNDEASVQVRNLYTDNPLITDLDEFIGGVVAYMSNEE